MNGRRLVRTGLLHPGSNGCAAVAVSVPCHGCRSGPCAGVGRAPLLALDEVIPAERRPGDPVRISISASGLTGSCLRLFGPALLWMAVVAVAAPAAAAAPGILAALSASGLIAALLAGRWLAARRIQMLDLRIDSVEGQVISVETIGKQLI